MQVPIIDFEPFGGNDPESLSALSDEVDSALPANSRITDEKQAQYARITVGEHLQQKFLSTHNTDPEE